MKIMNKDFYKFHLSGLDTQKNHISKKSNALQ